MDWLQILKGQVAKVGVVATAELLGISHTSVSLAVKEAYPAKTTRLARRVLERLGAIQCPHIGAEMPAVICARWRTRTIPQSDPAALKHWAACRRCPIAAALAKMETAHA